jgi:cytochrome c oxidase subunit 2
MAARLQGEADVRAPRAVAASLFLATACGGGGATPENVPVVTITAQQWSFSPNEVVLQKGVAVDLQITSHDVHHGFNLPDFNVRADVVPGSAATVRITPDKAGTFLFHCDYYCGSGHEGMSGQIVVR